MDNNTWLLISLAVFGLVIFGGFFHTKTRGFGRFATSALLMMTVVFITALLLVAGKIEARVLENVFFAVVGFAGGLITGKDSDTQS